jgi:hypothetical protein
MGDFNVKGMMEMKSATILISTVLALGMASPSWAQGSLEQDDNGGGHPGQTSEPYYPDYHPRFNAHLNNSGKRDRSEQPRTTGRGSSIERRDENGSPNGARPGTREDD